MTDTIDIKPEDIEKKPSRGPDGRWLPGNAGNPTGHNGAKRRDIYRRMIEEAGPLLDQAILMAKNGDKKMLKFLLSRIFPQRGILEVSHGHIELSENSTSNIATILRSFNSDDLTASDANELLGLVQKQIEIQSNDVYQLNLKFNELQKKLEEKKDD